MTASMIRGAPTLLPPDPRRERRARVASALALLGAGFAALALSGRAAVESSASGAGLAATSRSLAASSASASASAPAASREEDDDIGSETTFLLGIFSTLSEEEARRRELIRETYLEPFKYDPRVCSLDVYARSKSEMERRNCVLVYAFVVGAGDPNGPPERVDDGAPLTLDRADHLADDDAARKREEGDVVYLNIRENMEDGKSPTWFKYGSQMSDRCGLDYVAKTDSDAYINVGELLGMIRRDLPPSPYNVRTYGGTPWANLERSDLYMAGQFYFVSSDLARYVTHELTSERRGEMWVGTEDMDFGAYVSSHPRPVKMMILSRQMFWDHPIKDEGEWVKFYDKYEAGGGRPLHVAPVLPFRALCQIWRRWGKISAE